MWLGPRSADVSYIPLLLLSFSDIQSIWDIFKHEAITSDLRFYFGTVVLRVSKQHHVLTASASMWAPQQVDLWRSDGHWRSRRHAIVLSATQNLQKIQRTASLWKIWRPDPATRSQCGLSAGRDLSVTTSPALAPQVCVANLLSSFWLTFCVYQINCWHTYLPGVIKSDSDVWNSKVFKM